MSTDDAPPFDLSAARESYEGQGLAEDDLAGSWSEQLDLWVNEAWAAGVPEANAMVLATVSPDGQPATRTVLCKALDTRGVVFFTNHTSRKGQHLAAVPRASATFPWIGLARQVTVIGPAVPVAASESDEYFASRPRGSQLGAWASNQSSVVEAGRGQLVAQMEEVTRRFDGVTVPRPAHWGGVRIEPVTVEFWQGRPNRLHDRLRFRQTDSGWIVERLSP